MSKENASLLSLTPTHIWPCFFHLLCPLAILHCILTVWHHTQSVSVKRCVCVSLVFGGGRSRTVQIRRLSFTVWENGCNPEHRHPLIQNRVMLLLSVRGWKAFIDLVPTLSSDVDIWQADRDCPWPTKKPPRRDDAVNLVSIITLGDHSKLSEELIWLRGLWDMTFERTCVWPVSCHSPPYYRGWWGSSVTGSVSELPTSCLRSVCTRKSHHGSSPEHN